MQTLKELVEKVPPELEPEVKDFVEFLLSKRASRERRKPTFDWAGGLKELKSKYSSVELQHEIVSFDSDFDRTEQGRVAPGQIST